MDMGGLAEGRPRNGQAAQIRGQPTSQRGGQLAEAYRNQRADGHNY